MCDSSFEKARFQPCSINSLQRGIMTLPFWCSLSLTTLPSEAPASPPHTHTHTHTQERNVPFLNLLLFTSAARVAKYDTLKKWTFTSIERKLHVVTLVSQVSDRTEWYLLGPTEKISSTVDSDMRNSETTIAVPEALRRNMTLWPQVNVLRRTISCKPTSQMFK